MADSLKSTITFWDGSPDVPYPYWLTVRSSEGGMLSRLHSLGELSELRDQIDAVVPRKPEPKADVSENFLDILLEITDDFDRERSVKSYLRSLGIL